jgi:hypothetical protein
MLRLARVPAFNRAANSCGTFSLLLDCLREEESGERNVLAVATLNITGCGRCAPVFWRPEIVTCETARYEIVTLDH